MSIMRSLILITFFLLSQGGCTAALKDSRLAGNSQAPLPYAYFQQKALDHESRNELQQALFAWQIAAQLQPDNPKIPEYMASLAQRIDHAAITHYKKGVDFYRNGKIADARREFLITLRLSPSHNRAQEFLKKKLHSTEPIEYAVQPGDSFNKIANQVYNDAGKAGILAYYNNLDLKKPLLSGTVLLLPDVTSRPAQPQLQPGQDITLLLEQAEKALSAMNYDEVLAATTTIQKEKPDQLKARALADQAHFARGKTLMEHRHYRAALAQFKHISDAFIGRDAAIEQAGNRIRERDLFNELQAARKQLGKKAYSGVIAIVEQILARDPKNAEARQLYNDAYYALGKHLVDKDENALAIQMLTIVEQDFKDTKDLLTQARGRLNTEAETYYRRGIKHFINEELEKAIESWQKALAINPMHVKARQDMENAGRLLEKWHGLEK